MSGSECRAHDEAARWISEFLGRPLDGLGRDGAVCPYVEPSVKAGTLRIEERRAGPDPSLERLVAMLWTAVADFLTMRWDHPNKSLHSLVVVIPDLDDASLPLLGEMHKAVKREIVEKGLMIGHFHPRAGKGSVRNADLEVARSPVPMFAVRHSNFYDIVFNHENRVLFQHYVRRYGRYYLGSGRKIDPFVANLFREAVAKHRQPHVCGEKD